MDDNQELLVWWVSEADQEVVVETPSTWPAYLRSQYESRRGRAGRGRLWIAPEINCAGISWDENKPLASELEKNHGGIVIRREDAEKVRGFSGIITTLNLDRV